MFVQLKDLQILAGVTENPSTENPILDNETEYDEYEESSTQTVTELTPIERRIIVIPSNGNVQTNASASDLEIKFRVQQAKFQLNQLRDLIADISFQFSHVIRGQIRKNIRTRSQKRVKSLHNKLTLHARIYTRCRNHMVALNCGPTLLGQYQVLTKQDLKSSTAILDPNKPGSTSLKLSWIWHSGKWLLMQEDILLPQAAAAAAPKPNAAATPVPNAAAASVFGAAPVTIAGAGAGAASVSVAGQVDDTLTLQECEFPPPSHLHLLII
jgi:hypothetical protein